MKSAHTPSSSNNAERRTSRLPLTQRDGSSSPERASIPIHGWMLCPQRLFLGGTFVYAGLQKLMDPQFFRKATPGYIGNQIIGFAQGSPLHFFLIKVALPHAILFGWAVALGELAIGLGTLLGLLFRPAAFFGLLLSLLFFLTASWHVYPYFYGADIVFALSWLTLLLTGPTGTGLPTCDRWLQRVIFPQGDLSQRGLLACGLGVLVLGSNTWGVSEPMLARKGSQQQRLTAFQHHREKRRAFLHGLVVGGVSMVGLALTSAVLHLFGRPGTTIPNGDASSGTIRSGSPSTSTTIAQVQAVPENSAVTFTIPDTGDPGVLIHLPNQQFVAFDATCTHAGCEVIYDPGSGHLVCPCHEAQYDPTHQAAVLQGPAQLPLTTVKIHVDSTSGAITLA
ncbi:MAG: Rieske 2Fe-2S domain-containing protein [Ktedonobacteraceae bacterium]|nr:Rieske 2Fe-2S domain-containing protein [Ktedonobacteraceae bacterium]